MTEITFDTGEGQETYYVVDQTVLGGMQYLLVANEEDPEADADALILKDVSAPDEADACYVCVEDETELEVVSRVFEEMLDVTFSE